MTKWRTKKTQRKWVIIYVLRINLDIFSDNFDLWNIFPSVKVVCLPELATGRFNKYTELLYFFDDSQSLSLKALIVGR